MDSIFTKTKPAHFLEVMNAIAKFIPIDDITVRFEDGLNHVQRLQNQWYDSLKLGAPDYSVYNSSYYLYDLWNCWVQYSRKAVMGIKSGKLESNGKTIVERLSGVRTVVDVGCGFGYTTAGLKEVFPYTTVYGTNIENTWQYKVASLVGGERGFSLLPSDVTKEIDLLFASEYFEHMDRPIEHLFILIKRYRPKFIFVCNSFTGTAIGHFNEYTHFGRVYSNADIGRKFNAYLRGSAYYQEPTDLWNNRPALWIRY